MIFDAKIRKHWPPPKKDYKAGDRVKVIDAKNNSGTDRIYLGHVGTVEGQVKDWFMVSFEDKRYSYGFWPDQLRPAEPEEISTPLPDKMDIRDVSFGWKCVLIGVMKPGRK